MTSIKNFRPLALNRKNINHQRIKKHMIFRSGNLDKASEEDIKTLKHHGIKVIYDLRSPVERKDLNHLSDFEIKHYNLSDSPTKKPMDHDFLLELSEHNTTPFMIKLYQDHLTYSKILKPLFKDIIKEDRPFLFHCAQGKDRTGIVGALLMFLLGFSEKEIISEYLKLDSRVIKDVKLDLKKKGLSKEQLKNLAPLHGVDIKYLFVWLEHIKSKHKNISHYIENWLELSQLDIDQFKERYLEK